MVGSSRLSGSWNNFLRLDDSKTELFEFLVTHIEMTEAANRSVTTKGEKYVSNMAINIEGYLVHTKKQTQGFSYMLKLPPVRGIRMSL